VGAAHATGGQPFFAIENLAGAQTLPALKLPELCQIHLPNPKTGNNATGVF
jgi:hypothetical protein